MQRLLAVLLICCFVVEPLAYAKVSGKEAMYVGGTIPNLPEGTTGALDTTDEKVLRFNSPKGSFEIPYENITSLEYGQKAGRRLGVALTITIWALPGQLVLLEMWQIGAPMIAVVLAVMLTDFYQFYRIFVVTNVYDPFAMNLILANEFWK